jgi:pilus assembly protein Flp/PilA
MKMLARRQNRSGIAMTEYLIILAVVAIAAILIVGLFGQQIKSVFAKSTGAMSGVQEDGTDQNANAQKQSTSSNGMQNFDTQQN